MSRPNVANAKGLILLAVRIGKCCRSSLHERVYDKRSAINSVKAPSSSAQRGGDEAAFAIELLHDLANTPYRVS